MREAHYSELAARDMDYWWFKVRTAFVLRQIRTFVPDGPRFLVDVGCGAGGFLATLLRDGFVTADRLCGLDESDSVLSVARRRGVPTQKFDASAIATISLPRAPDVITMLDVLEHLPDPVRVLHDLRRLTAPGAVIVILVPALALLWSQWDEHLGHYRRYDRRLLATHLAAAGWELKRQRYLFRLLVGPGLARKYLIQRRYLSDNEFPDVPPALNRLLTRYFLMESRLPGLPFGTSLGAVARNTS